MLYFVISLEMTDKKPIHLDFSKKIKPKWKRCGRKSEIRIYLEKSNIKFRFVDSINLSRNFLVWDDIIDDLPIIFQKCSKINYLDLSDNNLGGRSFIQFIEDTLNKYSCLEINISGNPEDMYLKSYLKKNKSRLIYEKYQYYNISELFCND